MILTFPADGDAGLVSLSEYKNGPNGPVGFLG
jgi:hypothetical protein